LDKTLDFESNNVGSTPTGINRTEFNTSTKFLMQIFVITKF
jgi:hypothetical protein